jgi:hypothetical protein
MLRLPPNTHRVRETLDMNHLVEVARPKNRHLLLTRVEAVAAATRAMREDSAIKSIDSFYLSATDNLILARIGRRGGVKKLWDFGTL